MISCRQNCLHFSKLLCYQFVGKIKQYGKENLKLLSFLMFPFILNIYYSGMKQVTLDTGWRYCTISKNDRELNLFCVIIRSRFFVLFS